MRASETDRNVACPASLIQIGTKHRSSKADVSAGYGTLIHHWKETGETTAPWATEKDNDSLDKKLLLSGTEREHYWPDAEGEHEVSFAINLTTLEVRQYKGKGAERDEWKAAYDRFEWLTGTIDWLHWGGDDTVPWVDDLKTGHWPVDPKVAGQLRSYALLPWVKAGCPSDWECAISVTTWERYPLDGRPHRRAHRLNGFDMHEHLEALRWAAKHPNEVNVVVNTTDPRTGKPIEDTPCFFCPNRMEIPFSGWMQSYQYSRYFSCWRGIVSRICEDDTESE